MKILLVGSGGREHALAWAMTASPHCDALYCAPGNAGIERFAECVDIKAEDVAGLTAFAKDNGVDLVVVGPEVPLVAGLADMLRAEGIAVFGPSQKAAQLEGSKAFMKDFAARHNIPTAAYGRFTDFAKAKAFIEEQGAPIVIKTDGLAAGKGVIIAQTIEEAVATAKDMLSGASFGDSGKEIIVEEFMEGEELSYFAISDGKDILPLTSAQDHKRVGDGDTGPNTGGMGAYSPAHFVTPELEQKIIDTIIKPTVEGMAAEGMPFTGVLFAGLMMVEGVPKLIEFNIRFGDPECQAIMMRLQADLIGVLDAAARGELARVKDEVKWSNEWSMCVVMAAKGYPGAYEKGSVIKGVDMAEMEIDNVSIFHAGTARNADGELIAIGGRVLGVTSRGENIGHARRLAYEAVDYLDWPEGFCRRDIGWRAIKAEKEQAA